jgi:hypothetical protein
MSAILKLHCYHSKGNDVIFVNNFQLLEACSIYVVQFLSSNKKRLFKKLNLNHDFVVFQKLSWPTLNAYTQSHAGVHVSRTHLQEHVVDMCRVLISLPTSPDRTLGNAETPRENRYAMDNVRFGAFELAKMPY